MIVGLKEPVKYIALYTGLVIAGVFFISVSSLFAHGDGASFEKEIGNYSIDIGYEPEKAEAGLPERFDFSLADSKTKAPVSYSDVWVRFEKEKNTIFATGIHNPEFGKAGLLYSFPEAGTYFIYARFEKDDKTLAETSFDLEISGGSRETKTYPFSQPFVWGILGVVLGLLFSKVIKKHA